MLGLIPASPSWLVVGRGEGIYDGCSSSFPVVIVVLIKTPKSLVGSLSTSVVPSHLENPVVLGVCFRYGFNSGRLEVEASWFDAKLVLSLQTLWGRIC